MELRELQESSRTKSIDDSLFRRNRSMVRSVSLTDEDLAAAETGPSADSPSHSYRPSLQDFKVNNQSFAPPRVALPSSYRFRNGLDRQPSVYERETPSAVVSPEDEEKKLWGLRVLTVRLLWTRDIRDCLFAYFHAYLDLFSKASSEEIRKAFSKSKQQQAAVPPSKWQTKATM